MEFTYEQGQVLKEKNIPDCIKHLFNNPLHCHWNYPHGCSGDTKIVKAVKITVLTHEILIDFLK